MRYAACKKDISGCGSVWLERRVRDAEAASSNLVTPTYDEALGNIRFSRVFHFVFNNTFAEKKETG